MKTINSIHIFLCLMFYRVKNKYLFIMIVVLKNYANQKKLAILEVILKEL
jgi:hypothetical protein